MEREQDTDEMGNFIATVNRLRRLVKFYLDSNCNETALFWAEKAATITDSPKDNYWLAKCMYRCEEYHSAAHFITRKLLDRTQPLFRWLAGLCLLEAKKYEESMMVLNGDSDHEAGDVSVNSGSFLNTPPITIKHVLEGFTPERLQSALLVLKGRVYVKLDKRCHAIECFKRALRYDVFCYEAFQFLVQNQMLTAEEYRELMDTLPFDSQCNKHDLLPFLYEEIINKHGCSRKPLSLRILGLESCIDLQAVRADNLFYNCAFDKCFKLTENILKVDPFHFKTLQIHISCLIHLNKPSSLFYLAHQLVDTYPHRAISWYAVGCYYFLIGNQKVARLYLAKAISLDKWLGPAWLAYGHSFSKENEHDQAMAAYFSACKLMKGSHLPLLYAGSECGLINNSKLAEMFFAQAQSIEPNDPFVYHEMGTIAFHNENFEAAEKLFLKSLVEVRRIDVRVINEKWEPLLNNLGHTYRKLKQYDEALKYHQHALSVLPQNPSTITCIGFVQALQGDFIKATESFLKVLSWKRDDTFCLALLPYLIEQHVFATPTFYELK